MIAAADPYQLVLYQEHAPYYDHLVSTATHPYDTIADLINSFYCREIVRIDGDRLVPCDPRTASVLESALGSVRNRTRAAGSVESLPTRFGGYRNRRYIPIGSGSGESEESSIDISSDSLRSETRRTDSRGVSDMKLAQLVAILYLRAKGYVIQSPLGSSRKPYHFIAWRSPAVAALAEAGLIINGCLFDELLNIRRLGMEVASNSHSDRPKDIAIILPAASANQAMKDYGAISQALRTPGNQAEDGSRVDDRSAAADQVYLCFPHTSRRSRWPGTGDAIAGLGRNEWGEGEIGLIVLEPDKLTVKENSRPGSDRTEQQIERYELSLKNALLDNFRVYELFDFMEKLDVEFCRDFEDQVFWEFDGKLRALDVKVIGAELAELISEDR